MSNERNEIRLWDSQWVNIVNGDYVGLDRNEAIALAVKRTEQAMASNYMKLNWPPARPKEPQA